MAGNQVPNERRDEDVPTSTEQWEGHEGTPTAGGGKWLGALLAVVVLAWIVAMVQIVRLPAQEVRVTAESAIWMAIAAGSGISAFILLIWKLHRA